MQTLGTFKIKKSILIFFYNNRCVKNENMVKNIKICFSSQQNLRNSFLRGFPLPFNVETLQAFGALFQIPHYYRKFLYCK
jgi:hypothetical protein